MTGAAPDALHGKRLYLDAARLVGSGVSCVDCHGGLPGGAHAIEAAANDPARVARAIDAVPQMAPLRGRLTADDVADLAAYLGDPFVASPALQLADRLDLGEVAAGTTARATLELRNTGALAATLTGPAALTGDPAFALTATTCAAGPLAPGAGCTIAIELTAGPLGLHTARLAIPHDWIYGASFTAVLATVTPAAPASEPPAGCTAAPGADPVLVIAVLVAARAITATRARGTRSRAPASAAGRSARSGGRGPA